MGGLLLLLLALVVGLLLVGLRNSPVESKQGGCGDGVPDDDPYLIGALNLTDEERALLGDKAPDPDAEIMTVRFTRPDDGIDMDTKSKGRYPPCDVLWTVHADGRLSRAKGTPDAVQDLELDDDFVVYAGLYVSRWPPQLHAMPPHIHANGTVYRLVWYKDSWYLNGADEEYRFRVMLVREAITKAKVECLMEMDKKRPSES